MVVWTSICTCLYRYIGECTHVCECECIPVCACVFVCVRKVRRQNNSCAKVGGMFKVGGGSRRAVRGDGQGQEAD